MSDKELQQYAKQVADLFVESMNRFCAAMLEVAREHPDWFPICRVQLIADEPRILTVQSEPGTVVAASKH